MRAIIVFISSFVVLGLLLFFFYSSTHNNANNHEQVISNLQKQSESTLSNYTTSIAELAQIPTKYKNDLIEIIKANMQGRYGSDEQGSKAVVQFMQEQNLQVHPDVYLNMQNAMISGRREFKISQDKLMDACKNYKTELGSFATGTLMRTMGFPKIDLNNYCEVVSDAVTKETFKTKEQKPVSIQ